MSYQIPLVFETTSTETQPVIQKLQIGNDLDIPLNARVDTLELKLKTLATWLSYQNIEIPDELLE